MKHSNETIMRRSSLGCCWTKVWDTDLYIEEMKVSLGKSSEGAHTESHDTKSCYTTRTPEDRNVRNECSHEKCRCRDFTGLTPCQLILVFRLRLSALFSAISPGHPAGLRGAKRAGAQLATRRVHKAAARRLAAEMQAAGIMIPGSDDAWKRYEAKTGQ